MILTPIAFADLPAVLDRFAANLAEDPFATAVFRRIRESLPPSGDTGDAEQQRRQAVELAAAMGIPTIDEEPAAAFSWDGHAIRTRSEPSVVIHEIAHWQLSPPERRALYDFGLGAGPETGLRAEADAQRALDDETAWDEENLTSLLGILWEVELGQPGLLAFLEQNWLEGHERPAAAEAFSRQLRRLRAAGFVDAEGHPTHASRATGQAV
ncbi:hypothetical protein [Arenibaculum pallidiluteum]|uniref:hypothetical protein n=1 Tax=Arenibaculum pallidiluteum TaxID=2812559 RepID=UPI001A96C630|nr:hypothetical protein [Arenibaculum pallidiluteum]